MKPRIDSANVPLEFRRLQTVDLPDWKDDAGHPELAGFLEAVAANTKGVVQPASKRRVRAKPMKPVLTVLTIALLGLVSRVVRTYRLVLTCRVYQHSNHFLCDGSFGIQRWSR